MIRGELVTGLFVNGASVIMRLGCLLYTSKNAPVVILDEATAYIDPENEAVVQRAVAKLVEGKTVIVIAPVSYTHLDVYKRQGEKRSGPRRTDRWGPWTAWPSGTQRQRPA